MFSIKFFPQILQDIFQYLPTIALKTISWKSFLGKSKLILKEYSKAKGKTEIFTDETDQLAQEKIKVVATEHNYLSGREISLDEAERILFFFFWQIKNPKGLSLDFRLNRFHFEDDILSYNYNGFFAQFDPLFQQNLWTLYESFYFGSEEEIIQSLDKIKLSEKLNEKDKLELCRLFVESFATNKEAMTFSFDEFQVSFLKIFEFFLKHKIQIPVDFIFLGMSLTTLFQTLSFNKQPINVLSVFSKAQKLRQ